MFMFFVLAIQMDFKESILDDSPGFEHYSKLITKYHEYIETWDEIYKIHSNKNSIVYGILDDIKFNLIDTGYFTPQEMIRELKKFVKIVYVIVMHT